jgi:hypothetical protein
MLGIDYQPNPFVSAQTAKVPASDLYAMRLFSQQEAEPCNHHKAQLDTHGIFQAPVLADLEIA